MKIKLGISLLLALFVSAEADAATPNQHKIIHKIWTEKAVHTGDLLTSLALPLAHVKKHTDRQDIIPDSIFSYISTHPLEGHVGSPVAITPASDTLQLINNQATPRRYLFGTEVCAEIGKISDCLTHFDEFSLQPHESVFLDYDYASTPHTVTFNTPDTYTYGYATWLMVGDDSGGYYLAASSASRSSISIS